MKKYVYSKRDYSIIFFNFINETYTSYAPRTWERIEFCSGDQLYDCIDNYVRNVLLKNKFETNIPLCDFLDENAIFHFSKRKKGEKDDNRKNLVYEDEYGSLYLY